ncbi:hypothetical protein J3E07_001660 [Methanococcus voltae]|uniref:Uncharacterized protein n=1 Tax=Methanococcus voltae TaxID=2188 RepID=A0A8J7RQ48_METVO|nr:hypothetical protein [Methanococcus voltae]MBP2202219.1 hypothetical protein [Methanococcus voltae]
MEIIRPVVINKTNGHNFVNYGKYLANALVEHNPDNGGRLGIFTGIMGTGKSTLMMRIMLKCIKQNEIVAWRGRPNECIHYIDGWQECTVMHVYDKNKITVNLLSNKKENITNKCNIMYYKNPKELIKNLRKCKDNINVIYAPTTYPLSNLLINALHSKYTFNSSDAELSSVNYFWHEFFYLLLKKTNTDWFSLYFDEFDDIIPDVSSGTEYWLTRFFKDNIKDYRKCNVSLYCAVHNLTDIYYTIVRKFQFRIYLKGALVPNFSAVNQNTTLSLKKGEYVIDNGNYGKASFEKLKKDDNKYQMLVEIEEDESKKENKKTNDIAKYKLIFQNKDIKASILKIIDDKGVDTAYKYLLSLKSDNKISESYYYKLKNQIFKPLMT